MHFFAALASALALQAAPLEPPAPPSPYFVGGSIYRSATLHVGARPAALVTSDGPERGLGATIQVTW